MIKIIASSWMAVAAGFLVGLIMFGIAVLYKDQLKPMNSFPVTERIIEEGEEIKETFETVKEVFETVKDICVEIVEYDMNTGTKTTTVSCTEE